MGSPPTRKQVKRLDSLTHYVVGMTLGTVAAATLPEAHEAVYWAAVAGSMAPDFDVVVRYFGGDAAYLEHHRGITHALPGLAGLTVLMTAILALLFPQAPPGLIALWFAVGWGMHVFMDCFNSYGTQALLPWSKRRINWDILFILDVYILVILAIGLVAGRAGWAERGQAAVLALAAIWLYIAIRTVVHEVALRQARQQIERLAGGRQPERLAVMPGLVGLIGWTVVVDFGDEYWLGRLNVVRGTLDIRDRVARLERQDGIPQAEAEQAVRAAGGSPSFAAFLRFARFPAFRMYPTTGALRVVADDLRFRFRGREMFVAAVDVHSDGRVAHATVDSPGRRKAPPEAGGPS